MHLHGITYLGFLMLLVGLALLLPLRVRGRQVILLSASYLFYLTWSPPFLILLIACSLFNFLWANWLRLGSTPARLAVGLGANVALLLSFKFAGSLVSLPAASRSNGWGELLVPVGISFYTFQAISYLIDTYRGYAEKPTFLEFSLYMTLWATILSGPICRLPEMLPQFRALGRLSSSELGLGCRRILAGLFQKVVIADTLAAGIRPGQGVTAGFDQMAEWGAWDVWFLVVGFGLQIFFDFCGYSNIAIGSARIFGLRLRENFNHPFLAVTPAEFWSRWHMSLSSWIRDYLFFPLAAAKRAVWWRNTALVLSMAAFGAWHGVGLGFLLWGCYQGIVLVAHRWLQQHLAAIWLTKILSWPATFLAVALGWPLFRATQPGQVQAMFGTLVQPQAYSRTFLERDFFLLVGVVLVGYLLVRLADRCLHSLQDRPPVRAAIWLVSPVYRATMLLWIVLWSEQTSPFVYVKF